MSGYRGGIFKCPYYSRDYREYLNCEGAKIVLPKEELDEYTRRYCASEEWRRCPIARALTLHYERTEKLRAKETETKSRILSMSSADIRKKSAS